jgi:hypothetical protein
MKSQIDPIEVHKLDKSINKNKKVTTKCIFFSLCFSPEQDFALEFNKITCLSVFFY